MKEAAEIVKSGTWLYDGTVPHEVWIIKQNFDYHYDQGYEDSPEELNSAGLVFQVVVARDGNVETVLPACDSMAKAISKAEKAIPQGIDWDDHRIQALFGGRQYNLKPDE